jgi:selenide,water dikinase
MTDVTGFGLLGHLLPMCRAANLRAEVAMDSIPLLPRVEAMAADGFVTGASARNWASYGGEVMLGDAVTPAQKSLLTDPQTSGGLLVACAPGQRRRSHRSSSRRMISPTSDLRLPTPEL